ncbi:hypothetical protein LUZ62_051066 [Rhynchospora pubera]|uniref:Uncharacterized protein n=1 Tax=Rhynchospora pubera TaxID=906938 RepID=A0AAV8BTL8_9POAL|nr:hypothetical protein LUZ62_080917 [Rhynchospora pubera]KAJ4799820.1 hypothetical protein LUZ62_051066 [Rhynchospora pubera]
MDRWTGLLNASLSKGSAGPFFTIAASLLLSPSKTLAVPSINAIFFRGDRVEGTGDAVIERLSDSKNLLDTMLSKFQHSAVNAWVVEASTYNGAFAVYKEMIPSVNSRGEPKGYDPTGFPASSSIVSIISTSINQIQDQLSVNTLKESIPRASSSKTIILGFSKGGTVVNQLVTELAYLATRHTSNSPGTDVPQISDCCMFPTSSEGFLNSISEFHYIDVGLNCSGAYLTDKSIFRNLSNYVVNNDKYIRFFLHGTPRQWCDPYRPWIRQEKDLMLHLLSEECSRSEGKLKVIERLYCGDKNSSLRMHFEIIDAIDLG